MAKDKEKEEELVNRLRSSAQAQIETLWNETAKKFMSALEDSDRRVIQLNYAVTLNLSENAPVIDTKISFRDKTKEGGMNVIKTFHKSASEQLEDPTAPRLPGEIGTIGKGINVRKDADEDEEAEPATTKRTRRKGKEAAVAD